MPATPYGIAKRHPAPSRAVSSTGLCGGRVYTARTFSYREPIFLRLESEDRPKLRTQISPRPARDAPHRSIGRIDSDFIRERITAVERLLEGESAPGIKLPIQRCRVH